MNIRNAIYDWVLAYNKKLTAYDRFNYVVVVQSYDEIGCSIFDNAFVIKIETGGSDYYAVFPEHQEPSIYHSEEYRVIQLKRVKIKTKEITI